MNIQKYATPAVRGLAFAGLLLLTQHALAQQGTAKDEDAFWFVQAQGSVLSDLNSASFRAALGGPVNLDGRQSLTGGRAGSLALGRQMTYRKDNGDEVPLRLDGELWSGSFERTGASLGSRAVRLDDRVRINVAFLNASIRLTESDQKFEGTASPIGQVWLKAGLGLGSVKYPDATAAFGCDCMRNASTTGTSFQLQLAYERHLSENTRLYGQIGRVWLPEVRTDVVAGAQTRYERLTTNALSVGLRYSFR